MSNEKKKKLHTLYFWAHYCPPLSLHDIKYLLSETYLAAEAFVDACDCFQKEPQACEKREGGAGNNQPGTVPPS